MAGADVATVMIAGVMIAAGLIAGILIARVLMVSVHRPHSLAGFMALTIAVMATLVALATRAQEPDVPGQLDRLFTANGTYLFFQGMQTGAVDGFRAAALSNGLTSDATKAVSNEVAQVFSPNAVISDIIQSMAERIDDEVAAHMLDHVASDLGTWQLWREQGLVVKSASFAAYDGQYKALTDTDPTRAALVGDLLDLARPDLLLVAAVRAVLTGFSHGVANATAREGSGESTDITVSVQAQVAARMAKREPVLRAGMRDLLAWQYRTADTGKLAELVAFYRMSATKAYISAWDASLKAVFEVRGGMLGAGSDNFRKLHNK